MVAGLITGARLAQIGIKRGMRGMKMPSAAVISRTLSLRGGAINPASAEAITKAGMGIGKAGRAVSDVAGRIYDNPLGRIAIDVGGSTLAFGALGNLMAPSGYTDMNMGMIDPAMGTTLPPANIGFSPPFTQSENAGMASYDPIQYQGQNPPITADGSGSGGYLTNSSVYIPEPPKPSLSAEQQALRNKRIIEDLQEEILSGGVAPKPSVSLSMYK